ncbi:MAG: L-aspartate oxidase [Acidimicrobiales bacterium]
MTVAKYSVRLDVLVLGSGVAGLSAAVRLAQTAGARVGVLTKGELQQATTRWAQGGVAAVLPGDEDSTDLHLADTLRAGAGLCDEAAVRILVDEGPASVHELIALGAVFDRGPAGDLARAREGGHSTARVLHAGGAATGAEVERALVAALEESAAAILEHWFGLDLIVEGGRCKGVLALDPRGVVTRVEAAEVILACGGVGQLFDVTTNPREATGDGIAMALRAGVAVADLEFVQFHPTALHHPAMPRPLVSEALRGHGAVLRTGAGERFVEELAPRDVVSRAIARELAETGTESVWLDCTGLDDFANRFPTIHQSLAAVGLDPAVEWLPVAPAAHHLSGGVLTNLDGATLLPGLWAAGETACTGVHGANRLASNSLLEGMVFGARVVNAVLAGGGADSPAATGLLASAPTVPLRDLRSCRCGPPGGGIDGAVLDTGETGPAHVPPASGDEGVPGGQQAKEVEALRNQLQRAIRTHAGVIRDGTSLQSAAQALGDVEASLSALSGPAVARAELVNLVTVGRGLVEAASARQESRGAHTRSDFPAQDAGLRLRYVHGGEK